MKWIASEGGPLICATMSEVRKWGGIDESSVGQSSSDYDRACEVTEHLSVIPCDKSEVLVLGGEPAQSAFIHTRCGVAIARWIRCSSAEAAASLLAAVPDGLPQIEEPKLFLLGEGGELVMLDSAFSLADSPRIETVELSPGHYEVSSETFAKRGSFEFWIHRFKKVGSTGRNTQLPKTSAGSP